jgi:hypothetical protein
MSGLPDIGRFSAQVGYSRLEWRVSKDGGTVGMRSHGSRRRAYARLLTMRTEIEQEPRYRTIHRASSAIQPLFQSCGRCGPSR